MLVTVFAMAGTAVAFASVFVLTRNPFTFTNSASFPFYVLGGVFVPIAILPGWIQPLSKGIFMSWSADLLRASLKSAPGAQRVGPARHGRAARRASASSSAAMRVMLAACSDAMLRTT